MDNRNRWVSTAPGAALLPGITVSTPACAATGQAGPCVTRLNNAVGDQITANYVIKNQSQNRSQNISGSVTKTMTKGFAFRGGFNYGVSKSLVEPSSTAGSSYASTFQGIVNDPNNPALAYSQNSPGKRVFVQGSYSHQYFGWAATTIAMFYDGHTNGNTSYLFASDANGDGATNDLIYIPKDTSEMNFRPLTTGGKTYTAADQIAAFEQLIQNDSYLSSHRGQYAERNAVFLPMVNRVDLSLMQDLFHTSRQPQAVRPDPARHHQLRQPVEQELGRRPAPGQPVDSDQPATGRDRQAVLQPADRQRRPDHAAATDDRQPINDGRVGRLRDDAQLPIHVPIDNAERRGSKFSVYVPGKTVRRRWARGEQSPRALFCVHAPHHETMKVRPANRRP